MNKEILIARIKEIDDKQQQRVTLVNQHNAAIEQLKAEWNSLNGGKIELAELLNKLEVEEKCINVVPPVVN